MRKASVNDCVRGRSLRGESRRERNDEWLIAWLPKETLAAFNSSIYATVCQRHEVKSKNRNDTKFDEVKQMKYFLLF